MWRGRRHDPRGATRGSWPAPSTTTTMRRAWATCPRDEVFRVRSEQPANGGRHAHNQAIITWPV
eukprot:8388507-Alexandrium_andersonii.AAC.1